MSGETLRENPDPELVQAATQVKVGRGAYLFHAGDPASSFFVVLEGELEVLLGAPSRGEAVVATICPGQLVGELEAMTGAARVASVLATEHSTLLELGTAYFTTMLAQRRPWAIELLHAIARSLARRLVAANERLAPRAVEPRPAEQELEDPVHEADLEVLDRLWS